MPKEFSVAITQPINQNLIDHLLRADRQEDLCFALWNPSEGDLRSTAILVRPILPEEGDRQVHGNASFNQQYFERVCKIAMEEGLGIAFLHSHPFPGWQSMSADDVLAEEKIAGATLTLTGLPLVGMTIGSDQIWSARLWIHREARKYDRRWCTSVRVVGDELKVSFNDELIRPPKFREMFKRTATVWGAENHASLARLRLGIVGLGSVGSIVAETLARMGFEHLTLIDFDEVQEHNLDRLLGATQDDIGDLKIDVLSEVVKKSSTAANIEIRKVPFSVVEKKGYEAALDCDVLFSCVDRPRARHILNHFAYAHLIPVIDGGIAVRFRRDRFSGVDWQLQTVGPTRACLSCIGAYDPGDVSTEAEGKLDDPSYLNGLTSDHQFKRNENVFPFSANLASLEVLQLMALASGTGVVTNFGTQRYRYNPGIIESDVLKECISDCVFAKSIGIGDKHFTLYGTDIGAEKARERQKRSSR